ncbi:PREDICTED: general transcriptional corepressor trfA-like isoform X2 [Nicrophorus vespilloides]|uniref:General transcriptional corepressor trfA-like isoform X2 n=1 Tax=Nicrophorus vespilloides TaxID=110193 RepID=A0ABM1M4Y1_NICVS|nr:PREDICTED: general transcriptional corepressor trfA-like isoform X2 [Nicrophorus vespilloides]
MKVTASRSCKKRAEEKKKTQLKQSGKNNNFLIKHKLENLKTVETILDDENIIYKSSVPLSNQILKDVPFVKLIHDNITKKKLYLMRLNTRIDLDDNNILTDPKMIKQIPYVKMEGLETPENTSRRTRRTAKISPIIHSTPTRSNRCAIIISSDEEEEHGNELSTENISPIKSRRRKSDLSMKEKSLLSPSIMKASNEKSYVKKKVSFAESVSFLDDESDDSDETYSNEKTKSSTSKDKKDKSEIISRKSKRLNNSQNTESANLIVDEIAASETSTNKKVKPSASQKKKVVPSKTFVNARKSNRINDLNKIPMPASKRRRLMEKIIREEVSPKKQKPMPASKKRKYEEKLKNAQPGTSTQENNISETLTQNNSELIVSTKNETEDNKKQKNKNSETKKKMIVKPMPASVKRMLLCKMLKKPMPASKRRLLEEKYNDGESVNNARSKRKITELPENSSSGLKKLKKTNLLKPMPASQRRKLENRLKKEEELKEQIQNSSSSDEDDNDFVKNNHESECDSPIPGNMSAEMLHKRDHVSKSKKRYSLDCSALETKNLLSEFSSEDEQNEKDEVERVIVLDSDDDDDDVNLDETKEDVQNTEKEVTRRKTTRKQKPRIPFIANKQIVKMKRKIKVLNKSILQLKKKRDIKIRFKKTKEYKCDVCFKAYMEKCNLQLHFLKHVQPLEIEIHLYRYKLPIHFNVTPYNEQKFLKSKREMNRFLNEDINNLVNKYVAHRDNDTDEPKMSGDSVDGAEENAVILDNVLITAPNNENVDDDDAVENDNELPANNMNASVETVILEQPSEGSQCDTVSDEANETETSENENNVNGQNEVEATSELNNVENELALTKENQSSTVEASKDHDHNPVEASKGSQCDTVSDKINETETSENENNANGQNEVEATSELTNVENELALTKESQSSTVEASKDHDNNAVVEDEKKSEEESGTELKKPSADNSELNINNEEGKQDKRPDEVIEKVSIDAEENIVNLESNSKGGETIVDISEEKGVEILDKIEETQSKCVEISDKINAEDSIGEIKKTAEIDLRESAEEAITASTSKDSDVLDESVEKEVTTEGNVENVEMEASTTETNIEDKAKDDTKQKESAEDSNDAVLNVKDNVNNDVNEESITKNSGNDDEATTEEVDKVSEDVESAKSKDTLAEEDFKESVEEENHDHEDKVDDLHLCVESDDTQDATIADNTTKKTTRAKENEDKLVSIKVAKSGDFEKFLKCFDTESLNLPNTSAEDAMSQAELINTLESPKED